MVNPLLPAEAAWIPILAIAIYVGFIALGLLLLYGVIRVAVSRGLRDHHQWLEKNRPRDPGGDLGTNPAGRRF